MQFGVVYLARSRANRSRLLAVKTIKPGKVGNAACVDHIRLDPECLSVATNMCPRNMQESDGVSPTAIRELMLLELKHEHIIHLDSVHLNRQARQPSCMRGGSTSDHLHVNAQYCTARSCK